MQNIVTYSLFYSPEDGKLHKGDSCTEENERLVGKMKENIYLSERYQGNGLNLILQDFTFCTSADIGLIVPDGTKIYLKGKNKLQVMNDRAQANVAVLYSKGSMSISGDEDSELKCLAQNGQGLWSRCICARFGNLLIEGGAIYAFAGEAGKCSGIYAGGRFHTIPDTGGIRITGGKVYASAKTNAIRASEGKLCLEPPSCYKAEVENAREYKGSSHNWTGETLTQMKSEKPLFITFNLEAV